MKIEVYVICYNEEVMLPYFLRHYSEFCDRIIVYDNYSTDRTEEICKQNPKVEVRKYDSGNQIRDDIYLQIKNNCWKDSEADWVIVVDMDEFVYHENIVGVLESTWATVIEPPMFNMISEKLPKGAGQIYDEVKFGLPGGAKRNMFRPGEIREINYEPGCHGATPEGNIIFEEGTKIKTLHFRYLSKQYLIDRNALSNKRLSEVNKKMGWGVHYKTPAEELSAEFDSLLKQAVQIIP
jgi:glycosyltransferase involved in cell wall biosynthesis